MSDIVTEVNRLADYKTRLYNRLVAQGDTVIQPNDSMDTYLTHYQNLVLKAPATLNVTENGTYTASTSLISGYSTINVNVPTGGPATKAKYNIGDRVYDIGNNDIGVVYCFYTDENNVEYAVVCLNAEHRLASLQWASVNSSVTNMPSYTTLNSGAFGIGTETATVNCTLILASKTSTAVSHCRSKSFIIDGITYYGQLPNVCELSKMFAMHYWIYANDPTASSAGTSLNFAYWNYAWSSSQSDNSYGWSINGQGQAARDSKTNKYFVAPVLEIPNHSNS